MKNPLRSQIMIPVLLVLVGTISGITIWGMFQAGQANRDRLKGNLKRVAEMIQETRFSLGPNILENMKQLSGGEFVVCDSRNRVSYSTLKKVQQGQEISWLPSEKTASDSHLFTHNQTISGQTFLVTKVTLKKSVVPDSAFAYVLFSEADYQSLWWESATVPLIVGLVAIPVSFLLIVLVSAEVTRPLNLLRNQIHQITAGNWATMQTSGKGDEIDELAKSVNQMAQRLAELETQIRENERLEVMLQMGNGIAHNLRNSATGCRLAIEMHRLQLADVQELSDTEKALTEDDLDVATGQLKLMEKYIQRFLTLGKSEKEEAKNQTCDFSSVVEEVHQLLAPGARHQNVELCFSKPSAALQLNLSADDLEQVLINLINNAMEATGAKQDRSKNQQQSLGSPETFQSGVESAESSLGKKVAFDWKVADGKQLCFTVSDNGPGPEESLADKIFDSFVSDKSGGIGLGLYITKQIVESAGGGIQFSRSDSVPNGTWTVFEVSLPLIDPSNSQAENA